ncbi:metalloregulator ArsR/SmtB family transcription factor [candidate division TA06 bacterium]|uniref:Metalloregulator ArsR/SmtB family transcription factor n=1 Tax=candidate division TA06 bacterium TaxID=2250710 RepID=A0A933MHN5_UNCT6|nr:metalloregulator ArsR/SmtB family transcription factor [candidate division TA06 bacterium]
MKQTVKIFKALGDPTRLRIVKLLENGELCVCQLTAALDMGQSRISRHLSILKEAGLIVDDRKGKWVHYRLCCQNALKNICACLNSLSEDKAVKQDRRAARGANLLAQCWPHTHKPKTKRKD